MLCAGLLATAARGASFAALMMYTISNCRNCPGAETVASGGGAGEEAGGTPGLKYLPALLITHSVGECLQSSAFIADTYP